ncbi:hypothetical protein KIL84_022639, partial [Mauremys mutica]
AATVQINLLYAEGNKETEPDSFVLQKISVVWFLGDELLFVNGKNNVTQQK